MRRHGAAAAVPHAQLCTIMYDNRGFNRVHSLLAVRLLRRDWKTLKVHLRVSRNLLPRSARTHLRDAIAEERSRSLNSLGEIILFVSHDAISPRCGFDKIIKSTLEILSSRRFTAHPGYVGTNIARVHRPHRIVIRVFYVYAFGGTPHTYNGPWQCESSKRLRTKTRSWH